RPPEGAPPDYGTEMPFAQTAPLVVTTPSAGTVVLCPPTWPIGTGPLALPSSVPSGPVAPAYPDTVVGSAELYTVVPSGSVTACSPAGGGVDRTELNWQPPCDGPGTDGPDGGDTTCVATCAGTAGVGIGGVGTAGTGPAGGLGNDGT